MVRDRLTEIVVKPVKVYGTFFTVDEWDLPYEEVHQYNVIFRNIIIGTFWVSNLYKSSIQLFTPIDLEILHFILGEIKAREFINNTTNPEKSQNSA